VSVVFKIIGSVAFTAFVVMFGSMGVDSYRIWNPDGPLSVGVIAYLAFLGASLLGMLAFIWTTWD